ncbi:hypothetical protein ABZ929_12230 [Streptomyces physcomitrii]|uniref:hypothetical protein n=1 Tax=Streptomyces physcomitrii TaxID=2724184 RepID=UPI00340A1B4C
MSPTAPGDADGESRRRAELWGRASDRAQIFQSGRDQQITHIHVRTVSSAEGGSETESGLAVLRMDDQLHTLVQVLTLTAAEWRERCTELAEEAQRAREEGRAEALAEVQEQLRESELRVIQAQRMLREAQEGRKEAEALMLRAQQEAAQLRRAQDDREAAPQENDLPAPRGEDRTKQLRVEGTQLTDIMDEAEAQLASVREELRSLGEQARVKQLGPGSGTVAGETVLPLAPEDGHLANSPAESAESAGRDSGSRSTAVSQTDAQEEPGTPERPKPPVPGPPRRGRISVHLVLCALPAAVPMVTVTAVRAAYAADPAAWQAVAFTVSAAVAGLLVYAALGFSIMVAGTLSLDRDSESSAWNTGLVEALLGACLFLIVGFFTPLDWPGPAGEWGRSIAALVGLHA